MKLDSDELALRIFGICNDHFINLQIEWIRRDSNMRANFERKFVDVDDGQVTDEVFDISRGARASKILDRALN